MRWAVQSQGTVRPRPWTMHPSTNDPVLVAIRASSVHNTSKLLCILLVISSFVMRMFNPTVFVPSIEFQYIYTYSSNIVLLHGFARHATAPVVYEPQDNTAPRPVPPTVARSFFKQILPREYLWPVYKKNKLKWL